MNDVAEMNRTEVQEVRTEPSDAAEAERSAFAVHRDPSLTRGTDQSSRAGRGIAWVRPSDLIASSTTRIAGRGINLQVELAQSARRAPGQAFRATRTGVRDYRDRRTQQRVSDETSVFESFDVFEPQDRHPSSSWIRPSGIGLG